MRSDFKKYAYGQTIMDEMLQLPNQGNRATIENYRDMPKYPGVYLLRTEEQPLYVGETLDLQRRIDRQLNVDHFDFWGNPKKEIEICYQKLPEGETQRLGQAIQSRLIGRLEPRGNYKSLALPNL
jgi:hypothetical protein